MKNHFDKLDEAINYHKDAARIHKEDVQALLHQFIQIRMTIFSPEYLASHPKADNDDFTAMMEALVALQEDKFRMDWLEEHADEIVILRDLGKGTKVDLDYCSSQSGCPVSSCQKTLRKAVDVAVQEDQGEYED